MHEIVNPYIAGNPVTGTEMFFGREDVFDFVRQTLMGQHRDNVIVLYGQRRTGKTSVLYQMRSHIGARYLCVFTDLHGFALEGISGFLWELANHILRVLRREYQIELPRLNRLEFMVDPRDFFENEFLNQVWSAIGDRHLLLMLDESVRLEEQVRAGKLEQEIFEYMRHLMQHYDRLNFLFSLGSGLEEMEKEYSFLFSVGLYKKISFLDHDAATALITLPAKDYYQVESTALERILQITSGHPYYAQLLCHSLFNRWQHQQVPCMEAQDVEEILDEVVERGLAVLKHIWEESTPSEKAVMVGMATAMGISNTSVGVDDINQAWEHYDVVIPEGEIANAIRSLIARDVITGQDKYIFTVDLQRLWLQKYRRLDWVKEEIRNTSPQWLEKPSSPPLQPRQSHPRNTRLLLEIGGILIITILIIVSSLGSFLRPSTPINTATAIAQAASTLAVATKTGNQTEVAQAVATFNVISTNATATVQAQANIAATAQANATATSIVAPTATFIAANPDPYPPGGGMLALLDPLRDNSQGHTWDTTANCAFNGGAYHVSAPDIRVFASCTAKSTNFSNFAYEVQMQIIKGDTGGIIFRADTAHNTFYKFYVSDTGNYELLLCSSNTCHDIIATTSSPAIHQGLNQTNLVAVVALGNTITLYVNNQKIASVTDGTYSHGQIGLEASALATNGHPTEVVYSNAKVWMV